MMAITREDDFVSRAAGEWRNSSERVIAIIVGGQVFLFPLSTIAFASFMRVRLYILHNMYH
jgi:hypothetical protein